MCPHVFPDLFHHNSSHALSARERLWQVQRINNGGLDQQCADKARERERERENRRPSIPSRDEASKALSSNLTIGSSILQSPLLKVWPSKDQWGCKS
eukprot:2984742-Amphidinium_carterae.2